jgi:transmembrane sensor
MKTRQYYIDLIVRYLSGDLTQAEKSIIESWMEEKASNKKLFDDYKKTWENLGRVSDIAQIDVQNEWEVIKKRFYAGDVRKVFKPGIPSVRNFSFWFARVAAILVIALLLSITVLVITHNFASNSYKTDKTTLTATLPDGSQFTLNKGSTLKYPKRFRDDLRKVTLTGEAYFEVQPDHNKPFIVNAEEIEIKVLGTSFNVNAYRENDKIEVVVNSGKVAITKEGEITERLILQPGNKGTFNKSDQSLKLYVNKDPNFLSWKTREFVFENMSLKEIVRTINKVYNSKITIADDSLQDKRITVSFNNQSLDAILNVLSATLDINIRQNNSEIILTVKE